MYNVNYVKCMPLSYQVYFQADNRGEENWGISNEMHQAQQMCLRWKGSTSYAKKFSFFVLSKQPTEQIIQNKALVRKIVLYMLFNKLQKQIKKTFRYTGFAVSILH